MLRLLAVTLLLSACHRGLRFPGPLDSLRDYASEAPAQVPQASAPPADTAPLPVAPRAASGGRAVAAGAAALVERDRLVVDGERFRYDCSGMVSAAYASAGITIGGGSRDMHARAEQAGLLHTRSRPVPGDIAFFDNTYDRDRDGRRDDMLTHVGVVESVDSDGTISVVHLGSKGVKRLRMNLERPADPAVNSQLRATNGRDGGPVLAGQLWRDFGSLWKISA